MLSLSAVGLPNLVHDRMSSTPEADFDLEKLFLPAWAQESPSVNRYAKHSGEDAPQRRFDDRSERRPRPRRDAPRPAGGGGHNGPGDRRPGPRRDDARGPRSGDRGQPRRDERREAPLPLPEITVTLMPDEKGVDSLARQIKVSGRSFPLFDIAQMILQKPERQQVRFEIKKGPEGQVLQPLFLCAIDDTLWLSEAEAVEHVLSRHFDTFYQTEKSPTDPPKGTYTFVAQCGMSGVILGPPNYHDYQNQLRKLHAERFSKMPFDAFKSRVKIVKEEAVVKKWVELQSFKTEFVGLNVPDSPRLADREQVEKHFREVHLGNIVKAVEKHVLSGTASRLLRSPGLQRLVRAAWENQRKFPLQVATILSHQFASRGLQFFKVNRTITHVSVARPYFLDLETTPVSVQVKSIVEFINATPKCTRRRLMEALAPSPKPPETAAAPADPAAPPAQPAAEATATPEQAALIGDLHWLIHQGHVIEFANGTLETARKPAVKPPKPAPNPVADSAKNPTEAQTPVAKDAEPLPVPAAAEGVPAVEGADHAQPAEPTHSDTPEPSVEASAPAAVAMEPEITPAPQSTTSQQPA